MKKNGFTLIEILCVIILIGVLVALIVPNYTKTAKSTKEKMYDSKIKKIEGAAKESANDFGLADACEQNECTSTAPQTISVKDLVEAGYMTGESGDSKTDIINPINGMSMNDCEIEAWFDDNYNIQVKFNQTGDACSK